MARHILEVLVFMHVPWCDWAGIISLKGLQQVHGTSSGKICTENFNYAYASTGFGIPEYPLTQYPNGELNKA